MPIKPAPLPIGAALLAALLFASSAYAAPPAAASPYKLSVTPARPTPEDIPQPSNLNPNTALPTSPQAYQLEYRYRSQSAAQKRIKAELPAPRAAMEKLSADKITAEKPLDKPIDKPSDRKALAVAAPAALIEDFTPETLDNDKLVNQPFYKEIALAASAASLDPALVHAVIYVESRYRHSAISNKGAIGLMQILPQTAARYGVVNPGKSRKANLKAGTLYLRDLIRMFDNRLDLALAAYNAGEGAVLKHSMRIPPYRETRLYVTAVMAKYNEWRKELPPEPAAEPSNSPDDDTVPAATPAQEKPEYMAGTRLATSENFAPNY